MKFFFIFGFFGRSVWEDFYGFRVGQCCVVDKKVVQRVGVCCCQFVLFWVKFGVVGVFFRGYSQSCFYVVGLVYQYLGRVFERLVFQVFLNVWFLVSGQLGVLVGRSFFFFYFRQVYFYIYLFFIFIDIKIGLYRGIFFFYRKCIYLVYR